MPTFQTFGGKMKRILFISLFLALYIGVALTEEYQIHIDATTDWFMVSMSATIINEAPRPSIMVTNTQPIQEFYVGHGRFISTSANSSGNDFNVDYSIETDMPELYVATMKGLFNSLIIQIYHDSTTLIATLTNNLSTGLWNYAEYTVNLVDVDNHSNPIPITNFLSQNFPNPFNPSTNINYSVQFPANASINIYNSLGQVIRNLINEYALPGDYTVPWDGKDNSGAPVSAGTYFYQLKVGDYESTKRMILLK
jgi:hypothetical protein